jgi:hypothetical protein
MHGTQTISFEQKHFFVPMFDGISIIKGGRERVTSIESGLSSYGRRFHVRLSDYGKTMGNQGLATKVLLACDQMYVVESTELVVHDPIRRRCKLR